MFRIKHEPDAMDLTNRPEHLLSPTMEDEDEQFSHEEDAHDCIRKVRNDLLISLENNFLLF